MINDLASQFMSVLAILESDDSDLKSLALRAKRDPFDFYQGADLSGLNLDGADLTGMNFDNANLRSANLKDVSFDLGAFNASYLGNDAFSLKDKFDCYLSDMELPQMGRIYYFASFRGETLEKFFELSKVSYSLFCDEAEISSRTLRNARRNEVVSSETARSICRAMTSIINDIKLYETKGASVLRQPMMQILSLEQSGGFTHLTRKELFVITEISKNLDERRYGIASDHEIGGLYKNSPRILLWLSDYYNRRDIAEDFFQWEGEPTVYIP